MQCTLLILLSGCTIGVLDNPQVGMQFRSSLWADKTENGQETKDKNPEYLYVGYFQGGYLYKKNPYWLSNPKEFNGGIIVSAGTVIDVLTLDAIRDFERQKIVQYANTAKPITPTQTNNSTLNVKKDSLKIDVVAQVLNYSSGCSDDNCGSFSTWSLSNKGKCVYENIKLSDGSVLVTINLNDLDPRSIKFVTMNRASTEREEIRDPRNYQRIIGYNNIVNKYQTQDVQYMGKTLFSAGNLDVDRLKRGWTLIYSKYCSGTKKAF
jgi:hypothetical protein